MTCVEVRDRLAEQALGVAAGEESKEIERHLQLCAGCRKEFAELQEGAESLARTLVLASPPSRLEERVVTRVTAAAGQRGSAGHRRGIRVLVAATMAAVLLALGAMGWGLAQRQQAQTAQSRAAGVRAKLQSLSQQATELARVLSTTARPFVFPLTTTGTNRQEVGTAFVLIVPKSESAVRLEVVVPLNPRLAPYSARLVDESGASVGLGVLAKERNGDFGLFHFFVHKFKHPVSLIVVDRTGRTVMGGNLGASVQS
jgi:hypothetical protein